MVISERMWKTVGVVDVGWRWHSWVVIYKPAAASLEAVPWIQNGCQTLRVSVFHAIQIASCETVSKAISGESLWMMGRNILNANESISGQIHAHFYYHRRQLPTLLYNSTINISTATTLRSRQEIQSSARAGGWGKLSQNSLCVSRADII